MTSYHADDYVNSSLSDETAEDTVADDLSLLPLDKGDFSICELCGRIGLRSDFYLKNNKYCSHRCQMSSVRRKNCNWKFVMMDSSENMVGLIPLEPLPQLQTWHASFSDIQAGPLKHSASLIANSYEWKDELFGFDFLAAPVSLFKHAPLHEMWDNTFEGMKVEVKNSDVSTKSMVNDYFWVATVLKVKGYMGMLRYEGFGSDDSKDFWVNLCCSEVHPVGWCATRGKPLIPPATIEDKYADWKKFLVKQLTGARTLPANFYSKLNDSLKSRFCVGNIMEIVDKNRISQVKVASIHEIVGKRLHVKYYDSSPEDNGFWCHEDSPLIHPVGWAFRVGHPLDAPTNYCQRVAAGRLISNDTTPDMFYKFPSNEPPLFSEGMKLEAIDPLNLSSICAATVMQILNEGYMMIRIDCYPPDASGGDWFCYHQRSPCIFPVGFALANNIPLKPPHGYSMPDFNWEDYLSSCSGRCAPRESFAARGHLVSHGFVAGMRIECADLMDPRLVCVATIARVVADLLRVHFDGWGEEYDQWLWAHSTDMYPVGWCRAVGHRLEGPLQPPPRPPRATRRPRAARRRKRPHTNARPNSTEQTDSSDVPETKCASPITTATEVSADVDTHQSDADVLTTEKMETDPETVKEKNTEINEPKTETERLLYEVEKITQEKKIADEALLDSPAESMDMSHDSEQQSAESDAVEPSDTSKPESTVTTSSASTKLSSSELTHSESSVNSPPEAANSPTKDHNTPQTSPLKVSEDSCPEQQEHSSPEDDYHKVIPRLVNTTVPIDLLNTIDPENWTTSDVARFLKVNDCEPYCANFSKITGPMMLQLTKDEIIELLEMKVGPSLKIYDLIQQLKCKIKQPHRKTTFK